MSYMELKKCHQSLLAEKESLERTSKEKESQQQAVILQLAEEIKLYKVSRPHPSICGSNTQGMCVVNLYSGTLIL